jgi:hypothetical protein
VKIISRIAKLREAGIAATAKKSPLGREKQGRKVSTVGKRPARATPFAVRQ